MEGLFYFFPGLPDAFWLNCLLYPSIYSSFVQESVKLTWERSKTQQTWCWVNQAWDKSPAKMEEKIQKGGKIGNLLFLCTGTTSENGRLFLLKEEKLKNIKKFLLCPQLIEKRWGFFSVNAPPSGF